MPYLNSSLFEPTELEHQTLFIYGLEDRVALPVLGSTVLKGPEGKQLKGSLHTIDYLFAFLDAYDFSSEGSEEIQEDNKTLINASVLGLIFEKINGYKDGSFFTPGFITMYMCRETIRRAVVQKFNDVKGWDCKEYAELYDKIEDTREANDIINSLKICDPAVGSGHFLVSALNELIAIKSDLRILLDREGRRLKEYHLEVVNDELIVTDEDAQLFDYNPKSKESQRVQEALFHEKQTIIENCLFGVDINPNSVKICRLRLWIELLKNAYYKDNGQLETLPNIDINIKTGNSLISRFALDADLKQALKKSKFSIDVYKIAVQTYRNAKDKEEKREMERLIASIKNDFQTEINKNDPRIVKLNRLGGELFNLTNQHQLFGETKAAAKARKQKIEKLEKEVTVLTAEVEQIKSNKIYENAFEWRFEFPEVLNDEGDFVGFDVVIGNPPYGNLFSVEQKAYIKNHYQAFEGNYDIFLFFIEMANLLIKPASFISYITPDTWLTVPQASRVRSLVLNESNIINVVAFKANVFDEANVNVVIAISRKGPFSRQTRIIVGNSIRQYDDFLDAEKNEIYDLDQREWAKSPKKTINIYQKGDIRGIIEKMSLNSKRGSEVLEVSQGLIPYSIEQHEAEFIKQRGFHSDTKMDETYGTWVQGRVIKRYSIAIEKEEFLRYGTFLHRPRKKKYFEGSRILIQEITGGSPARISATIYTDVLFHDPGIISCLNISQFPLEYILALLNSRLLSWYHVVNSPKGKRNQFPKILIGDIRELPLKFSEEHIDPLTLLVKQILNSKNNVDQQKELDHHIDQLVYQLYGLTEEEIKIVEGEADTQQVLTDEALADA